MAAIAEVIRDLYPGGARMKKGGNYILIPCPFHAGGQERTPSCSVSTDKPVFYCHACLESGHISRLLRSFGLGKASADVIVERAGLSREAVARRQRRKTTSINPYRGKHILDEDVLDPYRKAPLDLLRSGFDKETLRHFEVGYDSTNLRITFPLRNIYGELVGISGRALGNEEPRYKMYGDELLVRARSEGWQLDPDYSMEDVKKALLWHGHLTRPFLATQKRNWLVLTEGFKACMWVFQAGRRLVNALIGMYLSKPQANFLAREVDGVILFLDNNEAGWKGTFHAATTLEKTGMPVRVARYPDDREQPDDLDPEEVTLAVEQPMSFIEWRRS